MHEIVISHDMAAGLLYGFLLGGGALALAWARVGWILREWKYERDAKRKAAP